MSTVKPFLGWKGGKRLLADEIIRHFPRNIQEYWEPFLGSGAVFFRLAPRSAMLSDVNADLITTYDMVRRQPDAVKEALEHHEFHHCLYAHDDNTYFLKVRDNPPDFMDSIGIAAWFIYLNKTCFNSVYRVNKEGVFNTGFGKRKNPAFPTLKHLQDVSRALTGRTHIMMRSFSEIVPGNGDLVYCDPPYLKQSGQYNPETFTAHDHRELRDAARRWRDHCSAYVVISNRDTPFIRRLYADFTIHELQAHRYISADPKGRGKETELLITSF